MQTANFAITGTTPNSATTAVVGSPVNDLDQFEALSIEADLVGATGGTLDLYLQTNPSGDDTNWVDYAHFAQLLAGAAALSVVMAVSLAGQQTSPQTVGKNLTPAFTGTGAIGGPWGKRMRCVAKAGAGTSAGATITINILGQSPRYQR